MAEKLLFMLEEKTKRGERSEEKIYTAIGAIITSPHSVYGTGIFGL